jgi:hypothetical protein
MKTEVWNSLKSTEIHGVAILAGIADAKLYVDRPINGYDVLDVLRLVFVGIICGMFARLRGNV